MTSARREAAADRLEVIAATMRQRTEEFRARERPILEALLRAGTRTRRSRWLRGTARWAS